MSYLILNDSGTDVFDLPILKQLSSYHSYWNPDLLTYFWGFESTLPDFQG